MFNLFPKKNSVLILKPEFSQTHKNFKEYYFCCILFFNSVNSRHLRFDQNFYAKKIPSINKQKLEFNPSF